MGVILSDGFDGAIARLTGKSGGCGRWPDQIIAPRIGGVSCSNDNLHPVHEKIGGAPSVLFDAVALLPGKDSLAALRRRLSF